MANRIKGITIEIDGDTTKLSNALKNVNRAVSSTKSSLTDVSKLLKLNPGNVDLLRQKQKLLADQISNTKEKLAQLKEAQARMDANGVDKNSEQYMALQREIAETENQLQSLEKEARNFGSVGAQQVAAVGQKMEELGRKVTAVGKELSQKVTAPLVALGVVSVKTTADFESSMSQVAATMGFTVDELNDESSEASKSISTLSSFAKQMGETTKFSASEAADALNYMALAGYDAETSMKMLPTVLNLAAAGNIELATASDMVTDAQSALGLTLDETADMVDQMAAAASKSNTSVAQLGEAYLKIGATARNLSGGTAELSTMLGVLADNGIKGAEGGTHLRNILLSLQSAAVDGAVDFGDFAVAIYDSDGNMRSMVDIIADMQDGLGGMSQEAKDAIVSGVFNKTDLASVNALLGTSQNRFHELGSAISDSSGAAQNMADTQLNNLNGQLTLLKSALEGAAISIGELLMPYIQKLVAKIQAWVDKFNQLSPAAKKVILVIAAVVAAIGPLLILVGGVMGTVGKILIFAPMIVSAIGAIAGPVGIVIVVIAALVAAGVLLYKNWDMIKAKAQELWSKLKDTWNKIKTNTLEVWNAVKEAVTGKISQAKETVVNTVSSVKIALENAWNTVKAGTSSIWNGIKTAISNALTAARTSVSSVVTGIKTTMSNAWSSAKSAASSAFSAIKSAITGPIASAKDTISGIVSAIRGFFPISLGNIFSGIKLPRFHIDWSTLSVFGKTISWPSGVSVSWFKKAMKNAYLLDGAQIFGTMGGRLLGGGESGKEIVMSYDKLAKMMGGNTTINVVVNAAKGMDERTLADLVARRIQATVNRKGAVWA